MSIKTAKTPFIPLLCLIIGSLCISLSAVVVAAANVGPVAVGVYRMMFGALILITSAGLLGRRLWAGWRHFSWLSIAAVALSADLIFWHSSIKLVGPGLGAILTNTQVFFLGLVGLIMLRETLSIYFFAAAAVAVLGIGLMAGLVAQPSVTVSSLGILLGIMSGAAYAAYVAFLRVARRSNSLHPMVDMGLICLVALVIQLIVAYGSGESMLVPDLKSWLCVLTYGILVQVVGWTLISIGLPRVPMGQASLILLLEPAIAFCADVLFFGRAFGAVNAAGLALSLLGIYIGAIESSKRSAAAKAPPAALTSVATERPEQAPKAFRGPTPFFRSDH